MTVFETLSTRTAAMMVPFMACLRSNRALGDFTVYGQLQKQVSLLLMLVVLLATACRSYLLDGAGLWADELWGVDACSQGSWWAMIDSMILKDSHPPGYQTLLYFWMQWFGDADATVRLPSVIAGVAAVHALYRFGVRFFTPLMGLVAATLLAVSYNAIYYSQEARAYIFLLLFAIWHYHLFLLLFLHDDALERDESMTPRLWVLFWLVGLLLCYFHYVGVVIVFSEAMALLLVPAFRQKWQVFLKAFQPILILYLPWLLVMMRHILHPDQSWETATPGWNELVGTARFIWGPASVQFYPAFAGFLLFLGLMWQQRKTAFLSEDRRLLLVLLLAFMPWALFFIKSNISASAYTIRHFIYIIPFAMLVSARWIVALLACMKPDFGVKTLASLLLAMVWLMMSFNTSSNITVGGKLYAGITKQEYREAVAVIAKDSDFMKTEKKNVFISNLFFDHYLRLLRVRYKPAPFMHQQAVEKMPEYEKYIREQGMNNFYYLEVYQFVDTRAPSPILRELRKRYHTLCATQFFWVQVLKFNTQLPPNPQDKLKSCPRSQAVTVSTPPVSTPSVSEMPVSDAPAEQAVSEIIPDNSVANDAILEGQSETSQQPAASDNEPLIAPEQ